MKLEKFIRKIYKYNDLINSLAYSFSLELKFAILSKKSSVSYTFR